MATQKFKNRWLDGFYLKLEELTGKSVRRSQERKIRLALNRIAEEGATTKSEISAILNQFNFSEEVYQIALTANYLSSAITDIIQNNERNAVRLILDRSPLKTAKNVFETAKSIEKDTIPEPLETISVYLLASGFNTYKKNARRRIDRENKLFDNKLVNDLRGDVIRAKNKKVEVADYLDNKWSKKKRERQFTWTQARVKRAVETQIHGEMEASKLEYAEAKGYTRKRWVTQGDSKVRTSHSRANGQTVGLYEEFRLDNGKAMYPSDPKLPPRERMNCRCFILQLKWLNAERL